MGIVTKAILRGAFTLTLKESRNLCCGNTAFLKSQNVRIFTGNYYTSKRFASSYRAAVLKNFGEPLVLEEVPRRPLKKGEIRIGVYCCGINSIDQLNVYGATELQKPPKLPLVPGYEVCGEVLEVSEEEDEDTKCLKPGSRVVGMHSGFNGGFAEEIVIPAKDVWLVNNSLSFETGASLVNSYGTALIALSRRAEVKQGDSVLITGAGGRLGLAAVDLAANVYRCKVIALCTSDSKAAAARDRGAFATIIEGKQDLVTEVKRANDGKGVKIVIDTIGGEVFKKAVQCADDEGKVVVTGFASKRIPQIGADELLENSYSVIGVSLDQYRKKKYDVYREAVSEVIEMADEKLITPYKAKHYPLEKVNEVLEILKDPTVIGKHVINIK